MPLALVAIDILGIWAGEAPYNLRGKHWTISTERTQIPEIGQGQMVKPYQKPHPPIVVTVVEPSSKSAADAASRGFDVISANFRGDFGTLLYAGIDWVDPRLARRSMELMAEEVMPAVNRAIAASGSVTVSG